MVSSNWDRVSLGDVCRVEAGAGFPIIHQGLKDQEFPFFKVGDMNTAGNEKEMHVFQHSISEEIRKKLRATVFPAGTIVFPKIGAAIATNKKRMLVKPSCVDNNVMALIPSENLDSNFLFYLLLNKDLSDFANTGNPPSIRQSNVEEWAIPLPPLSEQKRIASLLARADRLRGLRRAARRLADSLLQSVFLEMFGDGFGKWKVDLLENLADKIDYGVTASTVSKPVGPKFLRITDIQEGKVNWDDVPYCEISEKERNASLLSKGDIVFARTGATTGKSFLIQECPENSVFASYLIRVRPAKELNPVFLFGYFQTTEYWKQISESATGSTQPGVNSTKLGELKIPVPPLPLQEEFARVAARVEGLRARQAEAERQAEGLFQALLSESFWS